MPMNRHGVYNKMAIHCGPTKTCNPACGWLTTAGLLDQSSKDAARAMSGAAIFKNHFQGL
jgi:hypothetical protein